jgi:ADP-heptose:LPS heptosyltransferase
MDFLNERLGTHIAPTLFRGDIHLSASEQSALSPLAPLTGTDLPYWIIVAGGKYDYTIKWWNFRRWQSVVDHFLGRLLFVQVGKAGDYHPPLKSVIDLRGRTSLREVVRLTYHAQGLVCPVTFHMHLAAAVPPKPGSPGDRPCVVVAGGRESPHWEAYPAHQFIHTVGALPCCASGGCWRSRIAPLGDGDSKDGAEHLCVDVVRGLPHCMELITPEQVAARIEYYLAGGRSEVLSAKHWEAASPFLSPSQILPSSESAVAAWPRHQPAAAIPFLRDNLNTMQPS